MKARRAAEPTDLFWENLSVSKSSRIARTFMIYMLTLVVLAICFGINLGIKYAKRTLNSESVETAVKGHDNDDSTFTQWIIRILTFISSIIVVINNIILGRVVRLFTR